MRLSSYGPQLGSKHELPRGESASYRGQGADAPSRRVFLWAPCEQAAAMPISQVRGAAWRGWPADSKPGGIPSWHTVSWGRTHTEDERVLTISVAVGISRGAGQYARYELIMSISDKSSVSLASSYVPAVSMCCFPLSMHLAVRGQGSVSASLASGSRVRTYRLSMPASTDHIPSSPRRNPAAGISRARRIEAPGEVSELGRGRVA